MGATQLGTALSKQSLGALKKKTKLVSKFLETVTMLYVMLKGTL